MKGRKLEIGKEREGRAKSKDKEAERNFYKSVEKWRCKRVPSKGQGNGRKEVKINGQGHGREKE